MDNRNSIESVQRVTEVIYKQPSEGEPGVYRQPTWSCMKGGVIVLKYYKRLDRLSLPEAQRFEKDCERLSSHLRWDAVLKGSYLRNIGADHFTLNDILAIEEVMVDHIILVEDIARASVLIGSVIKRRLVHRFVRDPDELAFARIC
jgi:hypothetical protein